MAQETIVTKLNRISVVVKIVVAVLFVAAVGALVWSLFQPAITSGPQPPEPAPFLN